MYTAICLRESYDRVTFLKGNGIIAPSLMRLAPLGWWYFSLLQEDE